MQGHPCHSFPGFSDTLKSWRKNLKPVYSCILTSRTTLSSWLSVWGGLLPPWVLFSVDFVIFLWEQKTYYGFTQVGWLGGVLSWVLSIPMQTRPLFSLFRAFFYLKFTFYIFITFAPFLSKPAINNHETESKLGCPEISSTKQILVHCF